MGGQQKLPVTVMAANEAKKTINNFLIDTHSQDFQEQILEKKCEESEWPKDPNSRALVKMPIPQAE